MTANELADFIEISNPNDKTHQAIATMLRQQEAELTEAGHMIGVLREEISLLKEEIEVLKPYKEKIEMMERAYDAHIKKSMGEVKDLIKKARKVK